MEMIRYAIIDGAVESELQSFLAGHTPPHGCLYSPPVQADLVELAPFLVQVTPDVQEWLMDKTTPWGIYLESEFPLHKLLQHLRNYLWVMLPEQIKPVLFRFYDPRNTKAVLNVMTPRERDSFTAPITKLITGFDGGYEESFEPKLSNKKISNGMLTLSRRQFNMLNDHAQINYIKKLSDYIFDYHKKHENSLIPHQDFIYQQAEDCFYFCQSLGVDDDRSIRGVIYLMLNNDISYTDNLPQVWVDVLEDQSQAVHFRVETLLLQELGYIPQ